jgi:glycosyltransferase involved in cell wall biosynthesis
MKVTIVTPVFNGMPWLPDSIRSVSRQREDVELEHLVYDAESTDGSVEWLRENLSLGYELIVGPDEGQTDALAKGFARAGGDVLGWLNSDDLLEPGALKRVTEIFQANPGLSIVTASCLMIDSRGAIVGAIPVPPVATLAGLLSHPTAPAQPATFFAAEAYRQAGGLDRRYDLAMDLDLWFKLAGVGPIHPLPTEVLARFRLHPAAKTTVAPGRTARQDLRIRRRHGMPLRSRAAVAMIRVGYVGPVVSLFTRPLRRLAKRVILGPQRSDSTQGVPPAR